MTNSIQVFCLESSEPIMTFQKSSYSSFSLMSEDIWKYLKEVVNEVYLVLVMRGISTTLVGTTSYTVLLATIVLFESDSALVDEIFACLHSLDCIAGSSVSTVDGGVVRLGDIDGVPLYQVTSMEDEFHKLSYLVAYSVHILNDVLDFDTFIKAGCNSDILSDPIIDTEDLEFVFGINHSDILEDELVLKPLLGHTIHIQYDDKRDIESIVAVNEEGFPVDLYNLIGL